MTTIVEAREAAYQRFVDQYSTTAFTFENETFTPPTDAGWVRFSVRHRPGGQETLGAVGNRRFRRRAVVVCQIYTPSNQGLQESDQIVQAIRTIFEAVSFSGLDFNDTEVRASPPVDEWHVQIIEAFFDYDEIK